MKAERHPGVPRREKREEWSQLCTGCGLCCDGTIFGDLYLNPHDLKRLSGTPHALRGSKLGQPCPALVKGLCAVYDLRPDHCHAFECLLLQRVRAEEVSMARARRTIRNAKRLTGKVQRLLRSLGETNEELALLKRFQRVSRRLVRRGAEATEVSRFSDLTVTMQQLQTLLAVAFYPG